MKKVAFEVMGIGRSVGGGGAQRFFGMLYQEKVFREMGYDTYLVTDSESYEEFKRIKVIAEDDKDRVIVIPVLHNRFYKVIQSAIIAFQFIIRRFSIYHIGNFNGYYTHLAETVDKLPLGFRPKMIMNIVDCQFVPFVQKWREKGDFEGYIFGPVLDALKKTPFDGIYSWYKNIEEFRGDKELFPHEPLVDNNEFCYTDYQSFSPAEKKENIILFAARLRPLKNPLMFVESLKLLFAQRPELMEGWQTYIYGAGVQEQEIREKVKSYGLDDRVKVVSDQSNMEEVFPKTRLFISTQNFENFTSLSMLEAMASGNAIVARNVGQTYYFLEDGINGYLAEEDSPQGVADAMIKYLEQPERHDEFAENSRKIATEKFTKQNFLEDILQYWKKILA